MPRPLLLRRGMALRKLEDAGLSTYRSRQIVAGLQRIYLRANDAGYAYYFRVDVEEALQNSLDFQQAVRGRGEGK